MKKLALILAIVMVACFMFVACEKQEDDKKPDGSTPATQSTPETPASTPETPASTPDAPASTPDAPASTPTTPTPTPTPVGAEVWMDFSALATANKDADFNATEGIFTITKGKGKTSSGKTVKEGSKSGTKFTGSVQLGKPGAPDNKCITFTVPEGKTTLELYVYCGSSGVDGTFNVSVNGAAQSYPCTNANITAVTVTVKGGDAIAVYSSADNSTNVFGILIK